MPRRVQDIVPNTHRSIRDIPIERSSHVVAPIQPPKKTATRASSAKKIDLVRSRDDEKPSKVEDGEKVHQKEHKDVPAGPIKRAKKSGAKKWLFVFMGIVVVVAIAGYIASVYFSRASFTVVPKVVPFTVSGTYISQSTPGKGVLVYELATIKGDMTTTVPAVDGQKVSTTAKGKITIYNNFSTQSQRLIAGTRFADDTGRIYRLSSSVVVPGYTSGTNGQLPGSISANVVADQPGQSYNISKSDPVSDLKIVAYKGTAKYDGIYGRLAGDISGGFVGAKKTINPAVLASTTAELQAKVASALAEKLRATVPSGYLMYPKAYVTSYPAPTIGGTDPKTATITQQATVYGILFKREDLVARVAGEDAVGQFKGFAYETPGLESLDFSIANGKDFSPEKKNTLIIKLKGDAMLVGSIPVEELKKKFGGLTLLQTSDIMKLYKPVIDVEKSSGAITPPWSRVPSDPTRITVEVLTK